MTELFRFNKVNIMVVDWLLASPGHQQAMIFIMQIRWSLSYTRKVFNDLRRVSMKAWYKLWTYFYDSHETFSKKRISISGHDLNIIFHVPGGLHLPSPYCISQPLITSSSEHDRQPMCEDRQLNIAFLIVSFFSSLCRIRNKQNSYDAVYVRP